MSHSAHSISQKRLRIISLLVGGALLYGILWMAIGRFIISRELMDLTVNGWLLTPPQFQSPAEEKAWEAKVLAGGCAVEDSSCGTWARPSRLDFSKTPGKSVWLLAENNLQGSLDRAKDQENGYDGPDVTTKNSTKTSHMLVSFGEAYGDFQLWVDGKYVGITSRNTQLSDKFYPFPSTEAIPIPDTLVTQGRQKIAIKMSRFSNIDLPPMFRASQVVLADVRTFIQLESLLSLLVNAAIFVAGFFGIYHFFVWQKRRDQVYLTFTIYCLLSVCGMSFIYNIGAYFGVPSPVTYRARAVFFHFVPMAYAVWQMFIAGRPSVLWEHWQEKKKGTKNAVYQKLSNFQKFAHVLNEVILYGFYPILAVLNLFLPIEWAITVIYKISIPLSIPVCIFTLAVVFGWFRRETRNASVGFALPAGLGLVILQAGVVMGLMAALGVRQFLTVSPGIGTALCLTLFAVSLGHQFTQVFNRLGKLKNRLESILLGTRDLASAREVLLAAAKASEHLIEHIAVSRTCNVQIYSPQFQETVRAEGGKGGGVKEWCVSRVIQGGHVVGKPEWVHQSHLPALDMKKVMEEKKAFVRDSIVWVPIFLGDQFLALLSVDGHEESHIAEDESHYINALASALAIALENIRFLGETADKAKMEAELGAAKAVQEALLPPETHFPGLDIATMYKAAQQTGGDWFGYHYDDQAHRLDVYIGDVTGHGIPSALLTGVVCGAIYSSEHTTDLLGDKGTAQKRLETLAEVVNRVVVQTGRQKLLMTMLFLSMDLDTGEVLFLNAGHNHPYWMQKKSGKVKTLPSSGSRLGFTHHPRFTVKSMKMEPGDTLFLYTDGLIENHSPKGVEDCLGEKKLKSILEPFASAEDNIRQVMQRAEDLWQGQPPADDVTIFALTYQGTVSRETAPRKPWLVTSRDVA